MKDWRSLSLVFMAVALFLVGCGNVSSSDEKESTEIDNNVFLMFKYESTNDFDKNFGSLYYLTDGKEMEKVASDVSEGDFYYENDQDKVLFINKENELYQFFPGKEKEKLAEDVAEFNGNYKENIVTYLTADHDLYVINDAGKKDKIASSVTTYTLKGDEVYYIEDDGDFAKYHLENRQEKEIASHVEYFHFFNKDEYVYVNDDYALYYVNGEDEAIRVTGESVAYHVEPEKDGSTIIYGVNSDDGTYELYQFDLDKEETTKVASDVLVHKYHDGTFYYINNDENLFSKTNKEDAAKKLKSDITYFDFSGDEIYYLTPDNELFKMGKDQEAEKIKADVMDFELASNEKVVFVTEENDLYVDTKKVASDIKYYALYGSHLAFIDEDQLYVMENLGEKQAIEVQIDDYSSIYYLNKMVFRNQLSFEDIAGVWKFEEYGQKSFLDITKDGKYTFLNINDTGTFEFNNAGLNYLEVVADGENIMFTIIDENSMEISDYHDSFVLKKSSKKEADEYYAQVVMEQEKTEIESLIGNYVKRWPYAVNYGDDYYFADYIHKESPLYAEQEKFVQSMNEKGIFEEFVDYEIKEIKSIATGKYSVKTTERYMIYSEEDYAGKEVTQHVTYTVEKINGVFYIVDLAVSSSGETL